MKVTWDEIIERDKKGEFSDIQIEKPNGTIQRGPIVAVRRCEKGMVAFDTIWMACLETPHVMGWKNNHGTGVMVSDQCELMFDKKGVLRFGNSDIGDFKVFRKHSGNYLEPHEVRGLEPEDFRRTRAWQYDISLNSTWKEIVERVVNDLVADGLVDGHDQIRVQEEAAGYSG